MFGIDFSSKSFWQRVFKEILAKMLSEVFGRDSSFQPFGGEVSLEIFFGYFDIDLSSNMFGKYVLFRVYFGRCFFQVYLAENCSSGILGADFSANTV